MKHFANIISVQNIHPETALKYVNGGGIEKSLLLQQGGEKKKMAFLESSCPLIFIF